MNMLNMTQRCLASGLALCALMGGCPNGVNPPGGGSGTARRLFVGGLAGVGGFARDASLDGNKSPVTQVDGATAQIQDVKGVAVNKSGELLVWSDNSVTPPTGRICVFSGARDVNGDVAPQRVVSGASTLLNQSGRAMTFDVQRDKIYKTTPFATIHIFSDTSLTTFDGDVAPTVLTSTEFNSLGQAHVTADDRLYVIDVQNLAARVLVIENASTRSGAVVPDRIHPLNRLATAIFVDGEGTLMTVEEQGASDFVARYPQIAQQASGPITPGSEFQIAPPSAGGLGVSTMIVDADGTGFLATVVPFQGVLVFESIADLTGVQSASRTLTGPDTRIASPRGLAVLE